MTQVTFAKYLRRLLSHARLRFPSSRSNKVGSGFPGRHPNWPKTQAEFEEFWADSDAVTRYLNAERRAFYHEVVACLPEQLGQLLDIGCGGGYFLRCVPDHWRYRGEGGLSLAGVDSASSAVELACRTVPEGVFRQASAYSTGFSDKSFDIVVLLETFEHLDRPRKALVEAWRLVAPGGRLIITIPDGAKDSWGGHANFWSEDEFREFLKPLIPSTCRRLDEGRVLYFEIQKLPRIQPASDTHVLPGTRTTLKGRTFELLRSQLRQRGWDLVRYRSRPVYLSELGRFAYQAQYNDLWVAPGSRVLDVGSGQYPFPYATVLGDLHVGETPYRAQALVRNGRPLVVLDIHHLPFRDKTFDFVFCSHVLEHVGVPEQACAELIRVASEGYIETPTFAKDLMFGWAKGMHRWHVVAINNTCFFFEYNPRQLEGLRSSALQEVLFGDAYHPIQRALFQSEDVLNTMFRWHGGFHCIVLRLESV